MHSISVRSKQREELIDITPLVRNLLQQNHIERGFCTIFVPHTTAAVTINEHADSDVARDILAGLANLADQPGYRHGEGNSDAHLKASLMGASETLLIDEGRLVLGTWQGVFLAEFDGPRHRSVHIQLFSIPG